jgi:hypothetical protein
MTVNEQFAQHGTGLDDCTGQLIEVLAELLEEPPDPAASSTAKQGGAVAIADLRLLHGK